MRHRTRMTLCGYVVLHTFSNATDKKKVSAETCGMCSCHRVRCLRAAGSQLVSCVSQFDVVAAYVNNVRRETTHTCTQHTHSRANGAVKQNKTQDRLLILYIQY